MATNNYIQMQIISRNMEISYSGGSTTKVSNKGILTAKSEIDLTTSANSNYANLPNAGNNEIWYGIGFGSTSYYSQTNYSPFGVQNLQLNAPQSGMRFVIDLVHTETNNFRNTYQTTPYLRTNSGYGEFIYSPFNNVINGWVNVDENNVINVYVNSVNDTYFDQLNSAYRSQLFIQVIGHWELATSEYNITNMSTNCTYSNLQTTIQEGENYTNTFTPNNGYAFNDNNKPYATCNDVIYQSTLNQDGTATLTIDNVSGNIIIEGGSTAKYNLNLELYNCVLYERDTLYFRSSEYQNQNKLLVNGSDNALYELGENVAIRIYENIEYKLIKVITANDYSVPISNNTYLHIMNNILYLHWGESDTQANRLEIDIKYSLDYVLEGESYNFVLHSNTGFIFKTSPQWNMGSDSGLFSLNVSDKTIAFISWNAYPYITISDNLSIQANATFSTSLKYGFVSIYNPTFEEVDELSKKRFYSVTEGEMLDLSQYIISFRKLYVDIPQIARELVYFGQYNTNVSSNIVTNNFIESDCGIITIDEYNENSLDYNGVEIELYLPFIGSVSLNPNQIYNKQLHLVYRTNPLNGDCVAILFSDNMQISYSQGNVSFDIPINFKYGNLNNYGTNDNALYMTELQPYIEIKTNRQYQNMNNRLLNNNIWVQISECNGYAMFGNVELHPINNINKDEYDEIISLLQGGIII